ncbi:hypothetical protein U1Q18_031127 [Sarracenia purpurea var. burkii]
MDGIEMTLLRIMGLHALVMQLDTIIQSTEPRDVTAPIVAPIATVPALRRASSRVTTHVCRGSSTPSTRGFGSSVRTRGTSVVEPAMMMMMRERRMTRRRMRRMRSRVIVILWLNLATSTPIMPQLSQPPVLTYVQVSSIARASSSALASASTTASKC